MSLLEQIELQDIDFEINSSQQFATVLFDRAEDDSKTLITTFTDGKINQFEGDNKYNPSKRRHSSAVYVMEEAQNRDDSKFIKICTIQHKGITSIEVHEVLTEELEYLSI